MIEEKMIDDGVIQNCQNLAESYGEICVKCNKCGRFDKEKQIEEMVELLWHFPKALYLNCYNDCEEAAKLLYEEGYRKQSVGHWFIREYEYFTCSECGYDHWNSCDCTKEAKERLSNGDVPNYCPNCGAKMKGGAE